MAAITRRRGAGQQMPGNLARWRGRAGGGEHKHEPSPPHPRHTAHHWPDPGRGFREILLPRINSGWAVKIFMKSSPSRQPRFSELLLPGPGRDQQIASINTESGAGRQTHSQYIVNGSMLRPTLRLHWTLELGSNFADCLNNCLIK